MKIIKRKLNKDYIFLLEGIFNFEAIWELNSIFENWDYVNNGDVLFDLSKAQHIDSLAIGFLVKLNRRLSKYKKGFFLTNLSKNVEKIFELTNMDKYFKIIQNSEDKDFFD